MSFINFPPAVSPHKSSHQLQIQNRTESLPPLFAGEVVEVEIIEKVGKSNILILLKNNRILADSDLPLRSGEKRLVRVEKLYPRVVFRILQSEKSKNPKIADYMRFYRLNPKLLFDFFKEGVSRFNPENLGELVRYIGRDDLEGIQKIIQSMVVSRENLEKPSFFRDYIYNFGYLMEKGLEKALKKRFGKMSNVRNASQNLKGLLIKMCDKLQLPEGKMNLPGAEGFLRFAHSSLKIIEAHQVVNFISQENENAYMFQIPVSFPENMGLAEIFVKLEDDGSGAGGWKKQKKILFLLNMDALGEIVVETSIEKKNVGCVVKCRDENLRNFISPFLNELGNKLITLGYGINYLKCVVNTDSSGLEDEYRRVRSLYSEEGIDLMA